MSVYLQAELGPWIYTRFPVRMSTKGGGGQEVGGSAAAKGGGGGQEEGGSVAVKGGGEGQE
jgi:hypothetical protein